MLHGLRKRKDESSEDHDSQPHSIDAIANKINQT